MNRRDFLKALAAIGSAYCAESVDAASAKIIEAAWNRALSAPTTLYVDHHGAITLRPGYADADYSLRELFQIGATPRDPEGLIDFIKSSCILDRRIDDYHDRYISDFDEEETSPSQSWEDWVRRDGYDEVFQSVEGWLDDYPQDDDYLVADASGLTDRGAAVAKLFEQQEVAELLGIVLPKLKGSWSPDFGAYLRIGCEEANKIAALHKVPIRFLDWE